MYFYSLFCLASFVLDIPYYALLENKTNKHFQFLNYHFATFSVSKLPFCYVAPDIEF